MTALPAPAHDDEPTEDERIAAWVTEQRAAQGLPPGIEDLDARARLTAIVARSIEQ